jgi:hypothetical protein
MAARKDKPEATSKNWLQAMGLLPEDNLQLTQYIIGIQSERARTVRDEGYTLHEQGRYAEAIAKFEQAKSVENTAVQTSSRVVQQISQSRREKVKKDKLVVVSDRSIFATCASRPKIIGTSEDGITTTTTSPKRPSIHSNQRNAPSFFVRQTKQIDEYKKQLQRKNRKISVERSKMSQLSSANAKQGKPGGEKPAAPNLFVSNGSKLTEIMDTFDTDLAQNSKISLRPAPSKHVTRKSKHGKNDHSPVTTRRQQGKLHEMRIPFAPTIKDSSTILIQEEESLILMS